ncbi:hypothetical protein GCM10023075_16280 [Streptosporangium album]
MVFRASPDTTRGRTVLHLSGPGPVDKTRGRAVPQLPDPGLFAGLSFVSPKTPVAPLRDAIPLASCIR